MKVPMIQKRISFPMELLAKIHEYIGANKEFPDEAKAIRTFVEYGMNLISYKKVMQDPEKREQFLSEMSKLMQSEKIFDWVHTLESGQLDGIFMAIQMERENRTKHIQTRIFP